LGWLSGILIVFGLFGCAPQAVQSLLGLGASPLSEFTLTVQGQERRYFLETPAAAPEGASWPLVINLHAFKSSPREQRELSEFKDIPERYGFAVAYPEGIGQSWNSGRCCGSAARQQVDDVAFLRAMVEQIAMRIPLDRTRVFALGMSNGGGAAQRLACDASGLIAGVAAVSSRLTVRRCEPTRGVPLLLLHGSKDRVARIQNARLEASRWAERYDCDGSGPAVDLDGCKTFSGCRDGAEVTFCEVEDMGHCWPGKRRCALGNPAPVFDATERILEFFQRNSPAG